mgnify:CR=1 FL=1
MKISIFARVGKSPLIKAVGLQKNHKEIYYTEECKLDRYATGCFSCSNYKYIEFADFMPLQIKAQAECRCANCPFAQYKTIYKEHVKYVNEANYYGYAKRLTAIPLKLLLIYHFGFPNPQGIVRGYNTTELANYLGCSPRSIRNANLTLQEYGYIHILESLQKRKFDVMLMEYPNYAKTAREGGRGYATFNSAFLQEILKIKDINELRVFLRVALDMDTKKDPKEELSYESLQRFLPGYCKKGIIRKALSVISNLDDIIFKEDVITFTLNKLFHGRSDYENSQSQGTKEISEYISHIDDCIEKVNHAILNDQTVPQEAEFLSDELKIEPSVDLKLKHTKIYAKFDLDKDDIRDLGLLVSTYSLDTVKKVLLYIHKNYISKLKKLDCIGALARTLLKDQMFPYNLRPATL